MVRPAGIEPAHMASEANALSPELRAHINEFKPQNLLYHKTNTLSNQLSV